jgi:ubiquitin-like protein Pup
VTRTGASQDRTQRTPRGPEEAPCPVRNSSVPDAAATTLRTPRPTAAPQTQARDDDVDAILDEIDEVLESNAEEFVKGFVQKGGQ